MGLQTGRVLVGLYSWLANVEFSRLLYPHWQFTGTGSSSLEDSLELWPDLVALRDPLGVHQLGSS